MSRHDTIILAHGGELDGARPYGEVSSPFETQRLLLPPLCAEKLASEEVIPPLRLSAHKAKLSVLVVPVVKRRLVEQCKPGWTGEHPCARCVMERWREVMGGNPIWHGGPKLERLRTDEDVEGGGAKLLAFVKSNRPRFAFETSSPLAVPSVRVPPELTFPEAKDVPILLDDDALYAPEWTARFLGIATGTLYNWVSKGKIPHVKVGGNLRFPGEALRKWLESQTEWPTDDAGDNDGP